MENYSPEILTPVHRIFLEQKLIAMDYMHLEKKKKRQQR